MNLLKRTTLITGASLAVLCFAASPIALAHNGEDHSDDSVTSTPEDNPDRQADDSNNNQLFTATDAAATSNDDSSLRQRAEKLLNERRERRQNRKEKNQAQRQRACEARQKGINLKLKNLGNRAERHLKAFDTLFVKVKAYQDKNKLDVSNYDELVADVAAKQTTATAAVSELKAKAGSIDCSSADLLSNLAVDKTAGDVARTALQDYRSSLKTLIDSLLKAKTSNDSNTEAN
jgi:hypothetical protein